MKTVKLLPIFLVLLMLGCQQSVDYSENESVSQETPFSRGAHLTGKVRWPQPWWTGEFPENIVTVTKWSKGYVLEADTDKEEDVAKLKKSWVEFDDSKRTELFYQISTFYEYWKNKHVRLLEVKGVDEKLWYVVADYTGKIPGTWKDEKGNKVDAVTHSEATGYGMIIAAIMGDKELFDSLCLLSQSFKSSENTGLMSWIVPENGNTELRDTSASDGDIDIAYSLLMADIQWGSAGKYNYKKLAFDMIGAIKKHLINPHTKRVKCGDSFGGSNADLLTRPSDWLVAEFQAFYDYTKDDIWLDVNKEIYQMIKEVTTTQSSKTHLMPDFIVGDPAKAPNGKVLETEHDKDYYENACRYPWRVGMGYGHYKDQRSKDALDGFVSWARGKCDDDVWNYKRGYTLAGEVIGKWSGNNYAAPLLLAASHDTKNQDFINENFEKILMQGDWNKFFEDTIALQCALYLSGSWWAPKPGDSSTPNPVPTPEVPADPAATNVPGTFTLSHDNYSGGSSYNIIANMWWGQNATVVNLYENGRLVKTQKPAFASPSAQKIKFNFSGKAKGSYVYKLEAVNQHGATESSSLTYTVKW